MLSRFKFSLNTRVVFGLASLALLAIAVIGVLMWLNRPLKVSTQSVSKSEIAQALGVSESELGKITAEQFGKFVAAKNSEKFAGTDKGALAKQVANTIVQTKYPGYFVQGVVTPEGGTVENAVIKLVFPKGAVTEPLLVTFRTKTIKRVDKQTLQLNQPFALKAETLVGQKVTKFAKDIQVISKNIYNKATLGNKIPSTYYFNESLNKWEHVASSVAGANVVASTNHFSTYTTAATPPADEQGLTPEEEEYLYADCGTFVDDSYIVDENPDGDIDRTNCFDMNSYWKTQQVGALQTSLYSNLYQATANWYGDYKSIKGQTEVFAVLPDVPELRGGTVTNPETGEPVEVPAAEYAIAAVYYVYHDSGIERVKVEKNMQENVPDIISLGKYNFNETEAEVYLWGLTEEEATAGKYVVADAVCWGECPEGVGDITPPEIKNASAINHGSTFTIAADVTDSGSGVGNVYLSFNGQHWQMSNVGGDRYEVVVPSLEGINLNYFIIAYDKAGNEAIWNPVLGYVSRGMGLNIGVPPEAQRFVAYKQNYYKKVLPAKAGVSACNQCAGDPVNTQNGNLLEQIEVAKLAGRPAIDFNLQYNSLGGNAGIFGENWIHSYNYKVQEFSAKTYIAYPGGNIQEFKKDGSSYLSINPFLEDKLEKNGETFTLTLKDQTKIYFDAFGDAVKIVDIANNELSFSYTSQEKYINFSKLSEIRAEGGRKISLSYNATGLVEKVTLPGGKEVKLTFNTTNDLVSVLNENGNEIRFDYVDHTIIKKYSPEGHTYYTNEVDEQRRVTKQIAGDDFVQTYEYLTDRTIVRDNNGTVGEYKFTDGLMLTNTDEVGSKTKFEYDLEKRIIAEVDPEGNRTEYAYDDRGNQTLVKHADGTTTKREFNERNQLTRLEDHDSENVTTYEYDSNANLTKVTNALGEVTTYRYNSQNELVEMKDAKGFTMSFVYNSQGDLVQTTDKTGATTKYEYDDQGRRLAEIDALGRRITFSYDNLGNLVSVARPLGATETYQYDKNNRLVKAIDAEGRSTSFVYDVNENMVESTNALGHKKSFRYGEMNEILSETNEENVITRYSYTPDYQVKKIVEAAGTGAEATTVYAYNDYNAPISITDPEGRVSSFVYDSQRRLTKEASDTTGRNAQNSYTYNERGALLSQTDAEGRVTKYELDKLDRVVKVTNPEGGVTSYKYDSVGNKVSQTDPRGFETRFEYDGSGRLVKQINAKGFETSYKYDLVGNMIETTNANGVVTAHEYDALNRMTKQVKNPHNFVTAAFSNDSEVNVTTTYEYDKVGNVLKQTNPRGFATSFSYDALNRTTQITDAKGSMTNFAYNNVGSILSITDRNGNVSKKKYDALQRAVENINAKSHSTKSAYDKVGNTVAEIDAKGGTTNYAYNGLNQLVQKTDALSGITRYSFDKVNNLTKLTDANGHATTYQYDKLNRMIAETNPEGHKVSNAYDANNNPIKKIDAKGNQTGYEYDELNRLVGELNALGGKKVYGYDKMGNLLTLTDANTHTDKYTYDALDRLASETDAEGNMTTTAYDKNGNMLKLVDANGNSTNFEFDSLDRLVKEVNALGETKGYEYDKETNVTAEIAADGVKTAYNYDPIYLLSRVTLNAQGEAAGGNSQTNVDTNYKYDPNTNLTKIIDPKGNATNFAYDPLNRQVRETNALGNSWSFGYDAVGNRTQRVDANGQSTAYAYYPDNMLKAISYIGKYSVSYTYDANNNEVSIADNLGTTVKAYDALNRETSVKDALNRTLNYAYDNEQNVTKITYPAGKVVSYGYLKNDWMSEMKDPAGLVTSYNYDKVGNNTEIRNPNNTLSTYKYDAVNRVRSIQNMNLANVTNSSFYYSYDNVGQRTKVEKAYGWQQPSSVTDTYQYDPIRRLTNSVSVSSKGSITNNYSYDRNSNRVAWTSNDNDRTPRPFDKAELVYQYDAINELLKVTEKGYTPGQKEVLGTSTSSSSSATSSATSSKAPTKPQTKTTYKTVTKTKPVIVNAFIDGLQNFEKELEIQKTKGISTAAYTDLTSQLKALLKKAEAGTLTRAEAEKLVEKLRKAIEDYTASKDIKNNGIRTSLLTKLDKIDVKVLPVSLPTTTEKVPVTTTIPGNNGGNSSAPSTSKPTAPGQVKGETSRDPKTVKEVIFTYDRNGNRISKLIDGPQGPEDQLTLYSYDPENRLAKVLNQERGNTTNSWVTRDVTNMQYDALGRRLVKVYDPKAPAATTPTTTEPATTGEGRKRTEYLYNYRDPIAEYDILKSQTTDMYRGVANRIASSITFTTDGDQGKDFLHYDALNSVVGVTNADGGNNKNIRYHDFGKIDDNNTQRSDSTGGTNTDPHGHYAYTGQEWDEHTEVYEFYSRAYDPEFGVWLRQDDYRGMPRDPQSLHRYMYVYNSPVNHTDKHGYFLNLITAAVGGAVGAVVGGVVGAVGDYAGQVAQNLADGKSFGDAFTQVDTKSIIASGVGGAVSGAVCGAVAGVTLGVGIAVCGVAGGALGGAASKLTSNLLNGQPAFDGVLESAVVGGVVGGLSFGLASRLPGVNSLGSRLLASTAFGTLLGGGLQIGANLFDGDECTSWNHNLVRATVSGGTTGFLAAASAPYAVRARDNITGAVYKQMPNLAARLSGQNATYTDQSRTHATSHGHAANSPQVSGKSRFYPTQGGENFTQEVINNPTAVKTYQPNGRIRYTVNDMGRNVGTDSYGNPTSIGQVVVEGSNPKPTSSYTPNEVVTQYPGTKTEQVSWPFIYPLFNYSHQESK
jgi:RHS repeat-associated protein